MTLVWPIEKLEQSIGPIPKNRIERRVYFRNKMIDAIEGDINGVEKSFEKYITISSKYTLLATVYGLCYMVQLEEAMNQKVSRSELENGIRNYMLSFGLQDQIENLFKQFKSHYPESKLTLDHLTRGSIKMWRPSMIVASILE